MNIIGQAFKNLEQAIGHNENTIDAELWGQSMIPLDEFSVGNTGCGRGGGSVTYSCESQSLGVPSCGLVQSRFSYQESASGGRKGHTAMLLIGYCCYQIEFAIEQVRPQTDCRGSVWINFPYLHWHFSANT